MPLLLPLALACLTGIGRAQEADASHAAGIASDAAAPAEGPGVGARIRLLRR